MEIRMLIATMLLSLAAPLLAQEHEKERLADASKVLHEIIGMPESIPKDLLNKATCVLIFPSVKKAGFGFGASYGRGAISCRTGEHFDGPWSAPAMFALESGSIGLQIGVSGTDFILLVMNEKGGNSVLSSKVKLGADAAAAAGPKGRESQAATDIVLKAEILTYSRAKGAFAGVSLEGSTLRADGGANKNLYGHEIGAKEIVRQGKVTTPASGQPLIDELTRISPKRVQ
jgi:lipid-binding SYLF domain-containing protein